MYSGKLELYSDGEESYDVERNSRCIKISYESGALELIQEVAYPQRTKTGTQWNETPNPRNNLTNREH